MSARLALPDTEDEPGHNNINPQTTKPLTNSRRFFYARTEVKNMEKISISEKICLSLAAAVLFLLSPLALWMAMKDIKDGRAVIICLFALLWHAATIILAAYSLCALLGWQLRPA
jgi:hypothetical protein